MPCSRIEAPLAQCAPRLIGESNTGSWRIQTPSCTYRIDRAAHRAVRADRALDLDLARGRVLRLRFADHAERQLAGDARRRRP